MPTFSQYFQLTFLLAFGFLFVLIYVTSPAQERNNATSPLWLASPLPRRRHHRSTSRGARQRASCHLTTSTRSSHQLILTEVLVSEPVVIWVPASEPDQQRGRKEEHIYYSQRLDFQLEKWRQTLSRSTARLLSSDYNYQQQASLAPQAQTSNQDFARFDKLKQNSGWSTLAPSTPDDDWPSDQSLVNSLISKFNRIVFGFNRAKTKCSLNRVQVETLVKY